MADRRAALVDAGVELVLQQCFQDLLASVDTRSITGRAGVTTGSFFHHFRNRAQFADAVIERLERLWAESVARTVAGLEAFIAGDEPETRRVAALEWAGMVEESAAAGLQHLLWVARSRPVSDDSDRTGADVLRERYRDLDAAVLPRYERALAALGREMLPPFEIRELSVALTGLANGLEMRREVDQSAVRDGLYGDLLTSLVIAVTRPVGERAETGMGGLERAVVVRPTGVDRELPGTTWRQIAQAAAPLFAHRMVSDVKIAEIAEAAGVSASTVYHQFGSVSAVAAAGWVEHYAELEAIASEPLTATEGPIIRMEQLLTRYIQLARQNRGALEGLMLEVVAGMADRPRPVATMVPLPKLFVPHIRELRARGLLRRRIDSEVLARSVLQLAAMRVLSAPDEPEERIVDDTLGILLEGALAREGR
jgi:AcrR family transcriptional regulator